MSFLFRFIFKFCFYKKSTLVVFVHLFKCCHSGSLVPLLFSWCPKLVISLSAAAAAGNAAYSASLRVMLTGWFCLPCGFKCCYAASALLPEFLLAVGEASVMVRLQFRHGQSPFSRDNLGFWLAGATAGFCLDTFKYHFWCQPS